MENSNVTAGSRYIYVNSSEVLVRITDTLRETSRVGFDMEADGLHHYFEKVCLIQLSFLGKNYIIDPLSGMSLSGFFDVLATKQLILQGADYDLRMLQKSFGFRPKAPIFDTMIAAQLLGYEKIGLAALAEKICGVVLPKSGQKSDWSRRPLPDNLLKYASDDTHYLETIADTMTSQLQGLGRLEWHRECCEKAAKSAAVQDKNGEKEKEDWRIKGSSKAAPNVLVYVREIWKWRDSEAREKDRPPFMILLNEDIMKVAEWRAQHRQAPLFQGPAFIKRFSPEKFSRFESAIKIADNLPSSEWPAPPKKREWSDERPHPEKLERLLTTCKKIAEELKMESSVIASRASLTAVVLNGASSLEKMIETAGLMRWQAELLLPDIKKII